MRANNNQPEQRKVRGEPSLPSRRHLRNPLPAGSSPAGLCSRHVTGRLRRPALKAGPSRDRPHRLMRPIGIREALGCRQAGRAQRPPNSGPGRRARILAELRKWFRTRYVGTRDADTMTRNYSFGIGQSPGTCRSGNGIRNRHRPTRGERRLWVEVGRSGRRRAMAGTGGKRCSALPVGTASVRQKRSLVVLRPYGSDRCSAHA